MSCFLDPKIGLDSNILAVNVALSAGAAIPIVGSIPAALQVVFSAIITAVSLVVLAVTALPAICSEDARSVFKCAARHTASGLINTVLSVLKAIPFVGTCIGCCDLAGTGSSLVANDPNAQAIGAAMQKQMEQQMAATGTLSDSKSSS